MGRPYRNRLVAGCAGLAIIAFAAGALADPAPTAAPPPAAAVDTPTPPPFTGDLALKQRLDAAGPLAVAGDRLDRDRLQRFYTDYNWRTVWDSRETVVASLTRAVLAADAQGIDPALFHGAALAAMPANLSPIDRDLLLSDAFLGYADALARGAFSIEHRYDDEDLSPAPVDIVAALDTAMAASDPGQALTALAPNSPEYQALQRAYAQARSGAPVAEPPPVPSRRGFVRARVGVPGDAERHLRQLVDALERLRWLPREMPHDRIVVNTATQMLTMYRDDRPVFTTRVVVGQTDWQTPEFRSTVESVLFNPPWNVPPSILKKEILPEIAANPDYLAQHHMRYRGNRVEQEAGPYSALGRLKFELPDRFDVYLHDTPEKFLFARGYRMLSHGCVRVQNPTELASLVLDSTPQEIAKGIAVGYTHARGLPRPMPVFIVYQTALVEADGAVRFLADPYQRDDEIWDYLHRAGQTPVADEGTPAQRKG